MSASAALVLANSPKSARDAATTLARQSATKAKRKEQASQKIKTPLAALGGALLLGLAERVLGLDADELGLDNGVIAGAPVAIAGAFLPGEAGRWLMAAGVGMAASGVRSMARDLGADGGTTEGLG
jgi:hypothetical protein